MPSTFACYDEISSLRKVALCPPSPLTPSTTQECSFLGFVSPVPKEAFQDAYQRLHEALVEAQVEVIELSNYLSSLSQKIYSNLPNRLYVRDVAGVIGETLYLAQTTYGFRQHDFLLAHQALQNLGERTRKSVRSLKLKENYESIEFGDVLLINSHTLLLNLGNRTKISQDRLAYFFEEGFEEIALLSIPSQTGIIHLDLACNVLGKGYALALKELQFIPITLLRRDHPPLSLSIEDFFQRHDRKVCFFSPTSSLDFLTNYIHLAPDLILVNQHNLPRLRPLLNGIPIHIKGIDVEALEKGGGSIRCATLPLFRTD